MNESEWDALVVFFFLNEIKLTAWYELAKIDDGKNTMEMELQLQLQSQSLPQSQSQFNATSYKIQVYIKLVSCNLWVFSSWFYHKTNSINSSLVYTNRTNTTLNRLSCLPVCVVSISPAALVHSPRLPTKLVKFVSSIKLIVASSSVDQLRSLVQWMNEWMNFLS